ncbi:DUF2478 domain-containing protein [Herbaspirillum sp. HC18]|nr:DUF2478 domain-containing protein [Herbaspirillum sp. HC18]
MKHLSIAALVYGSGVDASPVLTGIVRELQRRGVALAGAIQHDEGPCSMMLELLPSGARMSISQVLGNGVTGCRLDSAALADAASRIRQAVDADPQLAVFNKFGAQEVEGAGLRDEIAAAVTGGIPVLVPVSDRFLEQWSAFAGGEFTQLDCSVEAALAWWDEAAPNSPKRPSIQQL